MLPFARVFELNFMRWAEEDLLVPIVSEDRVFGLVQGVLKAEFGKSDIMIYRDHPNWLKEWGWVTIRARSLKGLKKCPFLKRDRWKRVFPSASMCGSVSVSVGCLLG